MIVAVNTEKIARLGLVGGAEYGCIETIDDGVDALCSHSIVVDDGLAHCFAYRHHGIGAAKRTTRQDDVET